jgi:hypothetical protein
MLSYSHENWFFCEELAPESDQGQQATPDTAEVSADSSDLQEGTVAEPQQPFTAPPKTFIFFIFFSYQ